MRKAGFEQEGRDRKGKNLVVERSGKEAFLPASGKTKGRAAEKEEG